LKYYSCNRAFNITIFPKKKRKNPIILQKLFCFCGVYFFGGGKNFAPLGGFPAGSAVPRRTGIQLKKRLRGMSLLSSPGERSLIRIIRSFAWLSRVVCRPISGTVHDAVSSPLPAAIL